MFVCGVVPARGGSKGVPRKNIRMLGGKPLIAHAIAAGTAAKRLGRVLVSTDDPEIAEIARRWGGDVPFLRPADLAQDTTAMLPVLRHALLWLEEHEGRRVDAVTILDPTTPFRAPADIDACIAMLERDRDATVVTSVCEAEHNPYFNLAEPDGPYLRNVGNHHLQFVRRQDAPLVYRENAAACTVRREVIMGRDCYFFEPPDRVAYYVMPAERSVMIDTPLDFSFAEFLIAQGIAKPGGDGSR